jgi:pyruvate/2-oxoglutarate dehydrogenase complex dihydrolipoamide dehydrogenase (E3) component
VSLLEMGPHVLGREDADAARIVEQALVRDGVELVVGARLQRVEATPTGRQLHYQVDGQLRSLEVDQILVGAGRAPNVENLGLEAAGVEYDAKEGVRVDDRLRTTNRRIFAAGDCCMDWKFTHAADAAAKLVVRNALFFGRDKLSNLVMPWCTYTDPEIAHVGLYAEQARERGIEVDTFQVPLARVNRAFLDGQDDGFIKVHVKRGSDRPVGATIVAAHAGDLISELTLAIVGKVGLGTLARVIHPYPTQAEGIKAAANAYMRTRLTPFVKRIFETWLSWSR